MGLSPSPTREPKDNLTTRRPSDCKVMAFVAVPRTTVAPGRAITPVMGYRTGMERVGYQPLVHSRIRRQGVDMAPGEVHRAPWNQSRNVNVMESRVEAIGIDAPVTRAVAGYYARPALVAQTRYEVMPVL